VQCTLCICPTHLWTPNLTLTIPCLTDLARLLRAGAPAATSFEAMKGRLTTDTNNQATAAPTAIGEPEAAEYMAHPDACMRARTRTTPDRMDCHDAELTLPLLLLPCPSVARQSAMC
jgi:hypothetical protein